MNSPNYTSNYNYPLDSFLFGSSFAEIATYKKLRQSIPLKTKTCLASSQSLDVDFTPCIPEEFYNEPSNISQYMGSSVLNPKFLALHKKSLGLVPSNNVEDSQNYKRSNSNDLFSKNGISIQSSPITNSTLQENNAFDNINLKSKAMNPLLNIKIQKQEKSLLKKIVKRIEKLLGEAHLIVRPVAKCTCLKSCVIAKTCYVGEKMIKLVTYSLVVDPLAFSHEYEALVNYNSMPESKLSNLAADIEQTLKYSNTTGKLCRIKLVRVLKAFTEYYKDIDYPFGVGQIANTLLFHCNELSAFRILVKIYPYFDIKNSVSKNNENMHNHIQICELLIMYHFPEIYQHMTKMKIDIEDLLLYWITSFGTCTTPIELSSIYLLELVNNKWDYLYKILLCFIESFRSVLINFNKNKLVEFIKGEENSLLSNKNSYVCSWKIILKKASKLSLNIDGLKLVLNQKQQHKNLLFLSRGQFEQD